jgi:hypothetical protein
MPAGASAVLAMAMGPDLPWITDARHHAGHAIEAIAVLMAAHLVLCCAFALLIHLTSVGPSRWREYERLGARAPYSGMSAAMSTAREDRTTMTNQRASELAERLEQGANGLVAFAATLSPAEWQMRLPGDTRRIGTVVHHVASVYPIEIQLALGVAAGSSIAGLTMDDVHKMNAKHAEEWEQVSQEVALHLLRRNSADAAQAIRGLSDAQLAKAATVSLYDDAPVTCQFVLEDHAVRHSYHHLAAIRRALKR